MKKLFLSILAVSVVVVVYWISQENSFEGISIEGEGKYWAGLVEEVGAKQAFENFVNVYENKNFRIQHLASHLLGEVIFEKEGISGWVDCGGDFFYGCYHGFFARAVSFHGKDIISELGEICSNTEGGKKGNCYHGIGHGLVEYIGPENIETILSLCSQIDDEAGCAKGAFMEYNSPLIFQNDDFFVRAREFDDQEPYGLCEKTIPEVFKEPCYYELGWWWGNVFGNDYEKMMGLCNKVESVLYKKSCLEGVERVKMFNNS